MSKDTTYNGWTNWSTWVVNMHLDQDFYNILHSEDADDPIHEMELHQKADYLRDFTAEYINSLLTEDVLGTLLADMINGHISDVDWREIVVVHSAE